MIHTILVAFFAVAVIFTLYKLGTFSLKHRSKH